MKLSIRNKILLPLLATLALGMGCAGLIGYKASVGQSEVGSVVQKALTAKSLAAEVQGRLSDAAVVVDRVTAMTNFVSPKEVAGSFEPINRDIETDLEKLSALSLSSAIGQKLDIVRAAHKAWRLDAAILLGLTASNQVPTEEKIARSLRVLTGELQSLNARVDQDATTAIADASKTFTDEISQIIFGAGIVSVLVLVGLIALARSISTPVLRLSQGMQDLAEGSTQKQIPYLGRKDEMGQMAASVEVFRQNAIERARLEANTAQLRAQTEQQRLDDQRIAEERAQERLRVATSGLASGLQRLAAGDLSVRLSEAFTAEFEALRHDFNQSVQQLGEAMSSVMSSAHSIDSGTIAIRGSTEELANRTEQQAASLEETVAALNEVTGHVAQSTRMAEDASHLADQANQAANGSIQVVMRAVSAMGQIEASSSQINSIISVIDQIAFQTNLLALNAGVEAARAGEAGKGFAVVAQEVRELAQRSASAAQEIKQLIARSGNEVKSGVELVNQTGESLKTIGESITSMNQFMSTIVQTARDQSTGLQQVNTAMQQMDRVTQQNSQKVSEAEQSTRVLAAETERLRDLVQQFRMGEQRSSRVMPLARAS